VRCCSKATNNPSGAAILVHIEMPQVFTQIVHLSEKSVQITVMLCLLNVHYLTLPVFESKTKIFGIEPSEDIP
jgi:hypothetical protein